MFSIMREPYYSHWISTAHTRTMGRSGQLNKVTIAYLYYSKTKCHVYEPKQNIFSHQISVLFFVFINKIPGLAFDLSTDSYSSMF